MPIAVLACSSPHAWCEIVDCEVQTGPPMCRGSVETGSCVKHQVPPADEPTGNPTARSNPFDFSTQLGLIGALPCCPRIFPGRTHEPHLGSRGRSARRGP